MGTGGLLPPPGVTKGLLVWRSQSPAVGKAAGQRDGGNSWGREKLCSGFVSRLLCWFPRAVGLDNAAVAQKVSALCCWPGRSLGAKPQRGASLSSHLCANAS